MPLEVSTPIQFVKGVGPTRARMLTKAGIETVGDLLGYRPFRYEDRTNYRAIGELRAGEETVVHSQVVVAGNYTTPRKRVRIFELLVRDQTGSLAVKFFNQPYLDKVFRRGQHVVFFGRVQFDEYSESMSMLNPEYEILDEAGDSGIHTGRIVPVYRRVGKVYTRSLRTILHGLLSQFDEKSLPDSIPPGIRKRYRFPQLIEAYRQVHFPELPESQPRQAFLKALEESATPAHQRLIFDEFFRFQLGLKVIKRRRQLIPKERRIEINPRIRQAIMSILPFHPTAAQKRVVKEIVEDLCSERVMNRLVQGDVGSGKTIVALQALVVTIENGYQTVLMAPTEILAEQHFQTIGAILEHMPYRIGLLTGRVKGKARKEILSAAARKEIDILIGTHAVFQKGVEFDRLGLVVIDEQHRFGVMQRATLMQKGERPDTLVMTATPIPRTLAMTLYGDLDLSIIDELPPGRRPVTTIVKKEASRSEVYSAMKRELAKGRQAYVIYPLVEESEKTDLRAATEMSQHLQEQVFPSLPVGLMHGRLKPEEKEDLMKRFKAGEIRILVSTTVVEVGIDVPNATLMVVEHADRFGLSQLHQLRGRIGRGPEKSYCILMTDGSGTADSYQRLQVMRRTNDGFKIAEKDLELRGPGEFVGTRQSGMPNFRFGNIIRDRKLLRAAELEAENYVDKIVEAADSEEHLARIAETWQDEFGLYEVG